MNVVNPRHAERGSSQTAHNVAAKSRPDGRFWRTRAGLVAVLPGSWGAVRQEPLSDNGGGSFVHGRRSAAGQFRRCAARADLSLERSEFLVHLGGLPGLVELFLDVIGVSADIFEHA
jgi:hypothetical protein